MGRNVSGPPSFQLASYACNLSPNVGYASHRDRSVKMLLLGTNICHLLPLLRSPSCPARDTTAICYLNPCWQPERDGGKLRVCTPNGQQQMIAPIGGRLVVFDSGMEHAVLQPRADRSAFASVQLSPCQAVLSCPSLVACVQACADLLVLPRNRPHCFCSGAWQRWIT